MDGRDPEQLPRPFTVGYDTDAEEYYIFAPEGCVLVDGKAATINGVDSSGNVTLDFGQPPNYLWAHVKKASSGDGYEVFFDGEQTMAGAKWDFRVARFGETDDDGNQYDIATSVVSLGECEAAFTVKDDGGTWKVRYFDDGSFTYAGFAPDVVTPTPVEGWIDLNSQAKTLSVYGHATYEMDKDGDVVSCKSLVIDTSSTAFGSSSSSSSSSSGGSDTTEAVFTFHIADIVEGVVSQDALGAIHAGGNGGNIDVDVDEISVDYQATVPVSEGSGESASAESKVLEVKGWSSASATSGTSIAAQLGLPVQSGSGSRQVVVRNGVGGSLEYVEVGEIDTAQLADDIADELADRIGDGTLTIKQGDTTLGTFTANQATNSEIVVPANKQLTVYGSPTTSDGTATETVVYDTTADKTVRLDGLVTKGTAQTITGAKVFTSNIKIRRGAYGLIYFQPDGADTAVSAVWSNTANGNIGVRAYGSSSSSYFDLVVSYANQCVTLTASPTADPNNGLSGVSTQVPTLKWVDDYYLKKTAQIQSDWTQSDNTKADFIKNKPTLATVATSGSYNDLSNKPTIPAAQVQSDWNETDSTAVDFIKNKPTLNNLIATNGSSSTTLGKIVASQAATITIRSISAGRGINVALDGNTVVVSLADGVGESSGGSTQTGYTGTRTVLADVDYNASTHELRRRYISETWDDGRLIKQTLMPWEAYHQAVEES